MVRSLWAASCRVRYQSTVVAMASREWGAGSPKVASYLVVSSTKGCVELVGHLDHGPQYRVDQTQGAEGQLGHRAAVDRVSDLVQPIEIEDLPGGDGFGSW